MAVIAFIPARGGSERVPGKNLREVAGVPLVARAAAAAIDCDQVVVSTDDPQIAAMARRAVEVHHRPPLLAGPHAQIEDAIWHWLCGEDLADDDVIVLLQPTSPFRRAETVRACVRRASLSAQGACGGGCFTVTACPEAAFAGELYMDGLGVNSGFMRWHRSHLHTPEGRARTQDLDHLYREDGCVYAFTVRFFSKHRTRMACLDDPDQGLGASWHYAISRLESFEIDTEADLIVANAIAPVIDRLLGP